MAAVVLLLGLPENAFVGVDLLSFTATPKFQGVRSIPEGWHFVFASSNSALSVRHGIWFYAQASADGRPHVLIEKWDGSKEELLQELDQSEVLRWRANLGAVWRDRLTPYRQKVPHLQSGKTEAAEEALQEEASPDWKELTSCLSSALLARITGGQSEHWTLTTASSAARDLDEIPGMGAAASEALSEKDLNFLPVDLKRTWPPDATGRERTKAARDRSWALRNVVDNYCSKEGGRIMEVLGEFQFCFLMILTLNNYSCMEQWKRLLQLVLTSADAIKDYSDFYLNFLKTLTLQLQHCNDADGGLIDLSDDGATLLKSTLRRFRTYLDETPGAGNKALFDELAELETYLRTEHGWQVDNAFVKHGLLELEDGERVEMDFGNDDADDETGEYAPVIVDLSGLNPIPNKPSGLKNSIDAQEEDNESLEDMDERF